MRYSFTILLIGLIAFDLGAQPKVDSSESARNSLKFRYETLKQGSQTFKRNNQVYKVIPIHTLEAFWKSLSDSIQKQHQYVVMSNKKIDTLIRQKSATDKLLALQTASMEEALFKHIHTSIFGVTLSNSWLIFILLTLAGILGFLLCVAFTRMKYANTMMLENARALMSVTSEFEQFKKKSLERQAKLSRQLQDERNKVIDEQVIRMQKAKSFY